MLKGIAGFSKEFVRQKSTSAFTMADLSALKIRYVGVKRVEEMFPRSADTGPYKHLLLQGIKHADILAVNLDRDNRFDNEEKGFIQRLRRIIESETVTIGTEESKTCDMVGDLLFALGLNKFPLSVSRESMFKLDLGIGEDVTSKPEFTVEKGKRVLFVDEDKHIKYINRTKQWGEFQLAGEMLVCGLARNKLEGDVSIHGMRVIGTRFTFYHTVISEEYYMNLHDPNRPDVEIKRFPTLDDGKDALESRSLDYKDPDQRKIVVDTLVRIADEMRAR
ncbi:hypothetical protein EDD21DRAFT_187014 [Dissophora ornata]|nr:hypothetical protein BGZ58_007806 [Dissophora ornata]KAI8604847.1 hypothetical protein EDD21DRAFT_187014 [Dissophora ornata]